MDTHFPAPARQLKFPAFITALCALVALSADAQMQVQPLAVSTVAGLANFGTADGIASAAKFLSPAGVAVDSAGNVYVADPSANTIRKISTSGVVTTLAGTARLPGTNNGVGSAALFNEPFGVSVDAGGNVYVADTVNSAIRKIATNGSVTTVAGQIGQGPGYLDGNTNIAKFEYPFGIAVDAATNIYVADTYDNLIRKISPSGVVTTVAGDNNTNDLHTGINSGSADGTNFNAKFSAPYAIAVDQATNLYVADYSNNLVRLITPVGTNWVVTTLAGNGNTNAAGITNGVGTNTQFNAPRGIAVDSATNVYVADNQNNVIRLIAFTNGGWAVSTWAGSTNSFGNGVFGDLDGLSRDAEFDNPWGVAVDSAANVYVGDSLNANVRKITPDTNLNLLVLTLAGPDGSYGLQDATNGVQARFDQPNGVAVDGAGNMYVADSMNNCIRQVTPAGAVTVLAGSDAGLTGTNDGPNTEAGFNFPTGVCVDANTNLYVADSANSTVREITPVFDSTNLFTNWVTSTIAGQAENAAYRDSAQGTNALFRSPAAVAVDNVGNVYVADSGNNVIRIITNAGGGGGVSTYAGTIAQFNNPSGIAWDSTTSNVYVADSGNGTIRQIAPGGGVSTVISNGVLDFPEGIAVDASGNVYISDAGANTVLGIPPSFKLSALQNIAGTNGLIGSADGVNTAAQFDTPVGMAVDASGNVYVADVNNNTIRKGTPVIPGQTAVLTLDSLPSGLALTANGTNYPVTPQVILLASNSSVTVTATNTNTVITSVGTNYFVFANWVATNGTVLSAATTYSFTLTDSETVIAKYIPNDAVALSASPGLGGSVSGAGLFAANGPVTVTATANAGYIFTNWTVGGTVVGLSTNYSFTLDGNVTVVANFWPTFNVRVTGVPSSGGTVGGGGTFPSNNTVTVTATPANGYAFNGWAQGTNLASASATYQFTLTNDVALDGNFVLTPAAIEVLNGATVLTNGQTNAVVFPGVQTNQPSFLTFTVTNSGGMPLDLTNISVPTNYALLTNAPATITNYPWTIVGATNATFRVQLNTSNIGVFAGTIVITNNVTNFSFPVTGSVAKGAPVIQVLNGINSIINGQAGAVSFGSVPLNQAGITETFTITNPGLLPLNVSNITVPAGYTLTTNAPTNIASGGSGTFSVELGTAVAGTFAGNVSITSDDTNNDPFVFPVTGQVTVKNISLSGNLAFGVMPVGSSPTLTLTISNGGNINLTVSGINYPAGFSGAFSGVIAPNTAQAVPVKFSPLLATNYGGLVTVNSDATSGVGAIPISGFGDNNNLFLTVITNGLGKVAPVLTAKPLKVGTKYTLTATAATGNVFSNWTGTITTNKNPLTFVMETGTILSANFVPNPFLSVKGSYNGLFSGSNGITEQTAGMLKGLTIGTKGTYSGSLLINGGSYGLSGTFSLGGQATNKITRSPALGGNLLVLLNLVTSSNLLPQVTGAVYGTNSGVPWMATNLIADLASNLSFSSDYTITIPPDANNPSSNSIPGGGGYALVTNHIGAVKITGALADGTAFTQSVPASQSGDVPVYASLYANKGLLLGWINLDASNAAGNLSWVHPSLRTGLFTSAFVSTNPIALSPWTNPPASTSLPRSITVLEMSDGVITQTNNFVVTISNNYKFGEVAGQLPLVGSINPKTGQVTVTIGSTKDKQTVNGVILLNGTNGGGYFVTKTNSGAIILQP